MHKLKEIEILQKLMWKCPPNWSWINRGIGRSKRRSRRAEPVERSRPCRLQSRSGRSSTADTPANWEDQFQIFYKILWDHQPRHDACTSPSFGTCKCSSGLPDSLNGICCSFSSNRLQLTLTSAAQLVASIGAVGESIATHPIGMAVAVARERVLRGTLQINEEMPFSRLIKPHLPAIHLVRSVLAVPNSIAALLDRNTFVFFAAGAFERIFQLKLDKLFHQNSNLNNSHRRLGRNSFHPLHPCSRGFRCTPEEENRLIVIQRIFRAEWFNKESRIIASQL